MKQITRKFITVILTLLIAVPAMTVAADAASVISVEGGDSVTGGDVFTVTVTYDGESIGRVAGDVTYDTEMLSYISGGSSSGNVGYIELKKAGTGEPLTFTLEFQALKEGKTELAVSTSEMYDLGEMFMDTPSATKTVHIKGNAEEDEVIEETNPEDDAADEGLSVDEKEDSSIEASSDATVEDDLQENQSGSSVFLGKGIMYGMIALVLILIIAVLVRRKNK